MTTLRLGVGWIVLALGSSASAQVTQRVSVGDDGQQGNSYSSQPIVSADGRYVLFTSHATNFGPVEQSGWDDAFLRDRLTGTTELISVDSNEVPGSYGGSGGAMTPDGRYVIFTSSSSNLVPGDTGIGVDVFLRDRVAGTTERVSYYPNGAELNGSSLGGAISDDGRYVAYSFEEGSADGGHLMGGIDWRDVYVWDRQTGTGELVNVPLTGDQADGFCYRLSMSADGRFVAFESVARNLVPGDVNGMMDVFVRDLQLDTTVCVSLDAGGLPSDGDSGHPAISADGRYVAFASEATDLVAGDTNGVPDVFVHDRQTGTTERVSISSGGTQGNGGVHQFWNKGATAISADGRYVAFQSLATNLVASDTNESMDIFLRDRLLGTTRRISVSSGGIEGFGRSEDPSISRDGRFVGFTSFVADLVADDTNAYWDAFLRDRDGAPSFTSLCEPGVAGVIGCPCANPPGTPGRGCDNSSATGGASLSASGGTYLSSDSLVFSTSGEKPTSLSIVLQGTHLLPSGTVFGQGVRCAGGALKRLFVKTASGGGITAPDFVGGDPSVSSQSAAKGDPIVSGQSRWYLVYYRDPIVLGGCPATSTFNATQTGKVSWAP